LAILSSMTRLRKLGTKFQVLGRAIPESLLTDPHPRPLPLRVAFTDFAALRLQVEATYKERGAVVPIASRPAGVFNVGAMRTLLLVCALGIIGVATGQSPKIELRSASGHPMRYYLSLPKGWQAGKTWPVVVAIESANRDFKANAEAFVKARGDMPFILIIPEVITNGGPHYREASGYSYSESDWEIVANDGPWKFDEDGVGAAITDVHRKFGGETKYYLTGWEAALTPCSRWLSIIQKS